MSIRLRLTLLYTTILALTLIAFSTALYITVDRTTTRVLQDGFITDMSRLTEWKEFKLDSVGHVPSGKGKPLPLNTFVQTVDLEGNLIDRTELAAYDGIELPPLARAELDEVRGHGYGFSQASIGGDQWLIFSKKVYDTQGRAGIVQLARPQDSQGSSLAAMRRNMLIGGAIVIALAFGIGWGLSRVALQPIERIAQTARSIEESRDFSRRVDHSGPPDEVGRLARTFNGMLGALQASYDQTEAALQAQRRFVADASHELRTPLTTIRGNLALLGREPPISGEDRQAVLADMTEESERMSRLVDDLLTLARADAGRQLQVAPVTLAPLLDDLARQARLLAPERSIGYTPPADAAVLVRANRDALKQIALILLDNALKHTPPGTAIELSATVEEGQAVIAVRDTGPGLSPDVRAHLFERFYRADAARTRGGTGLGLAIARALTEAQGGTIDAESRPGEGSTFTVRLPLARLDAESWADHASPPASGDTPAPQRPSSGRLTTYPPSPSSAD
jgi:signal transduction histidine kinase